MNWRIFLLLFAALIPIITAIYYASNEFPKTLLFKYDVEITHFLYDQRSWGTICILEIKDINGNLLQPEKDPASAFVLTGDWVKNSEGCQYFSPGTTPGSLKISLTGITSEPITIYFRKDNKSFFTIISTNGEQFSNVLIHSKREGIKPETIQINPGHETLLFWKIVAAAGWTAILIVLLMMSTLFLNIIQRSSKISTIFALVEKYPWMIFAPIAIGIIIIKFWPSQFYSDTDMAYYLSLAKNLFHGNGYVNPDLSANIYRGPIFPLLVTSSYALLGESIRSAMILQRVLWVFTILITFLLGKQYFNQRVGFLASILVLGSIAINVDFGLATTDGPVTFFILTLQLMFWEAFSKQRSNKWYLLMGLLMGITYWLKQTALFIAPLPLLMWILFSEYRTRHVLKKVLIYYAVFAFFYFGWMGYVYLAGGSPNQVASDLNVGLSIISRLTSILNIKPGSFTQTVTINSYAISLPQILATFYNRDIAGYFRIAPFFLAGLAYSLFQAVVRRNKPDIHLVTGLLLFSSMIPIQVVANFGFRQNLYFYIICMIGLTAMTERLFNKIWLKIASGTLVLVISASLIFIQISGNYVMKKVKIISTPITNQESLGYFNDYQDAATWINNNVNPDERILTSEREANILHILTNGNRYFAIIPAFNGERSFSPAVVINPPYISIWTYLGISDPDNPRDNLLGISEPSLLATINDKNVSYVIVTPRIWSLYFYLKIHPDFQELLILDNVAIFRVSHPVQPISAYPNVHFETCIGEGTPEYLKNLEDSDPARFEVRLRDEFGPWMGLSYPEIKALQNWQGCLFNYIFPGKYNLP